MEYLPSTVVVNEGLTWLSGSPTTSPTQHARSPRNKHNALIIKYQAYNIMHSPSSAFTSKHNVHDPLHLTSRLQACPL